VSRTFHGRDVFAPCAAWLSKGTKPWRFGRPISNPVKLAIPQVELIGETLVRGQVIHVDRFGNLITNLTERHLPSDLIQAGGKLVVAGHDVSVVRSHYREGREGEVFAVIGSTGRVEISVYQGSAAKILGVGRGAVVEVRVG
jgi:S-adenosylmethionine hydrolase